MKRKIVIAFTLALAVLLGACTKMLDIKNADGRVDMKEVFSSKSRAGDYFHICINTIMNVGFLYDGTALASFCDEAYDASAYANGAITRWYYNVTSPSNNPLLSYIDYWNHYFQGIRRCNTFLINMNDPEIATGTYTEDEKTGWIAQVHAARAYFYLQLIKRYGGVPIIETPYEMDHDFSKDVRASFEECVDFIMAECDKALSYPEPADPQTTAGFLWVRKDGQGAYLSRAAAWAIKSQAALYAASPLWYKDGSKYNWSKAAEITKEALDQCLANGYALYNNNNVDQTIAQNGYALYFMQSSTPHNSWESETILQTRDNRTEVWKMAGLPITDGMERAGAGPTQELVDSYEIFDGTNAYPLLDLKKPYNDESHLTPNYNPDALRIYNEQNPYVNRDPRFYASIYYNGAHHLLSNGNDANNRVYTEVGGNCEITKAVNDVRHTRTGYYMRKFNRSSSNVNANDDGYMRLFRLGELYLNFAEAANNAFGPDVTVSSTVPGQTSMTATDAVNAIRVRVGMPEFPAGMSKADFELRYRNERRVELAFEEHRFFDVRRWKILGETDAYKTGMWIEGNNYKRFNLESDRSATADDKYLMFPINQSEVSKMQKLTGNNWQNPGW